MEKETRNLSTLVRTARSHTHGAFLLLNLACMTTENWGRRSQPWSWFSCTCNTVYWLARRGAIEKQSREGLFSVRFASCFGFFVLPRSRREMMKQCPSASPLFCRIWRPRHVTRHKLNSSRPHTRLAEGVLPISRLFSELGDETESEKEKKSRLRLRVIVSVRECGGCRSLFWIISLTFLIERVSYYFEMSGVTFHRWIDCYSSDTAQAQQIEQTKINCKIL